MPAKRKPGFKNYGFSVYQTSLFLVKFKVPNSGRGPNTAGCFSQFPNSKRQFLQKKYLFYL